MTEISQMEKPQREFTGKHMLALMLSFFGIIILVNLGMAILANSTWTGLVVKNSYVASQDFNDHLEEARIQKELGWQGDLTYQNGAIEFSLADKDARPISLDTAFVKIGRPAFEQQDQKIELIKSGAGRYRAEIALGVGPWAFSLRGKKGDQPYRLDTRIDVSQADGAEAAK